MRSISQNNSKWLQIQTKFHWVWIASSQDFTPIVAENMESATWQSFQNGSEFKTFATKINQCNHVLMAVIALNRVSWQHFFRASLSDLQHLHRDKFSFLSKYRFQNVTLLTSVHVGLVYSPLIHRNLLKITVKSFSENSGETPKSQENRFREI